VKAISFREMEGQKRVNQIMMIYW